jgi:hypothetical protein
VNDATDDQPELAQVLGHLRESDRGRVEWDLAVERAKNAKLRDLLAGRDALIAALQPTAEPVAEP